MQSCAVEDSRYETSVGPTGAAASFARRLTSPHKAPEGKDPSWHYKFVAGQEAGKRPVRTCRITENFSVGETGRGEERGARRGAERSFERSFELRERSFERSEAKEGESGSGGLQTASL